MGIKVDLACGNDKKPGYIGIDMVDYGQDVVGDIRRRLPFQNDTVERVEAFHIVEHLYWDEIERLFWEVHRILATGGIFHVQVPDGSNPTQYRPYHIALYSTKSFEFTKEGEWKKLYSMEQIHIGKNGHINFKWKKL